MPLVTTCDPRLDAYPRNTVTNSQALQQFPPRWETPGTERGPRRLARSALAAPPLLLRGPAAGGLRLVDHRMERPPRELVLAHQLHGAVVVAVVGGAGAVAVVAGGGAVLRGVVAAALAGGLRPRVPAAAAAGACSGGSGRGWLASGTHALPPALLPTPVAAGNAELGQQQQHTSALALAGRRLVVAAAGFGVEVLVLQAGRCRKAVRTRSRPAPPGTRVPSGAVTASSTRRKGSDLQYQQAGRGGTSRSSESLSSSSPAASAPAADASSSSPDDSAAPTASFIFRM